MAVALMAAILVLYSCKKDPEIPTGGNKILIGATVSDTVSYIFAKVSTQLNGTSGNQISQHGHCWSTESSPDIEDSHNSLGGISSPGKFTSDLSGLSDNTKYFVRSYVTFQGGTIYGIQNEIITLKRGKPVANTGVASDLTTSSVKMSGTATFDSGFAITQKGICWDTAANPNLLKSIGHSEEGAGKGSFISSVANLIENKQYYYCAYATNIKGTSYGAVKNFITVEMTKPTVITSDPFNITKNSASCGGTVTNVGNGTVTARGVCWNLTGIPTLTNCIDKTFNGSGIGEFSSQITGLTPGTTYYVAAYATNEKGTSYGDIKQFITVNIEKPTVITSNVTNITLISATCGGNVTSDGNETVTERGICWDISSNPTVAGSHTIDGSGTGVFLSYLTNLNPNKEYYIRAYATNIVGTSYGNEISFTTLNFTIGQYYGGGIIFYIDGTGSHGLIAAQTDQNPGTGAQWGCAGTLISGTSAAIGTGQANTTRIVNGCSIAGIAARLCNDLVLNGYSDWFLPSKDELNQMYLQRTLIGNFAPDAYWSSSEYNADYAWNQYIGLNGTQGISNKDPEDCRVRAVRAF